MCESPFVGFGLCASWECSHLPARASPQLPSPAPLVGGGPSLLECRRGGRFGRAEWSKAERGDLGGQQFMGPGRAIAGVAGTRGRSPPPFPPGQDMPRAPIKHDSIYM